MPVVDGVRISVSRLSNLKVQHIGKIVRAGSEIDREVSITHSGMLTSSSRRRGWIKRPITKNSCKPRLRRSSFDQRHSNTRSIICEGEQMQKGIGTYI